MKGTLLYADERRIAFPHKEESFDTYNGEPLRRELADFGDYKSFRVKPKDIVEVLAPASVSTYKQAVHGGAGAIYFGYKEFNARAGGENFNSIKEVVDYCHFYNVKAYLALNISFLNTELKELKKVVEEAEIANIDAFIICDLALVPIIRLHSKASIHASTQMGVHNTWGMSFLKDFRFNRGVLSREVNFDDIRNMCLPGSADKEVFIHGALCSCFSGGCLLSSMLTGNSANRGKCNQLCRKYYRSYIDGKPAAKGYLLSAKDICMTKYIDKLVDIGVNSLKIEGRLKRQEYVGGMSMYYSDLKSEIEPVFDLQNIKVLFNRGNFTPGYFENNNVIYTGQPNHMGIKVGRVVHTLDDNQAFVMSNSPLEKDNGYKIMRNLSEVGGGVATGECIKGFSVIKANSQLKEGDVVHLTSDKELADFICNRKKKKNVPIRVRIAGGEKPNIIMNIKGHKYTLVGDEIAQTAINHPITEDEIRDIFEGNRVREIRFIIIDLQLYNAFLTKAQLNKLRRKALDTVWRFLLGYYERTQKVFIDKPIPKNCIETKQAVDGDFCEVDSIEKAKAVSKKITNIVYNPNIYTKEGCEQFYKEIKSDKNLLFIKIPIYVPTTKEKFFEELIDIFDGVLANNVGAAYIANIKKKLLVCGQNMNITNTKNWLINNSSSYIVSTELSLKDVKRFKNPLVYTYGYLPLMYLNHCPRKLSGMECGDCDKELKYTDEKGEYVISTQKFDGYCEHVLHNGILTDIGNTYKAFRYYFDFTMTNISSAKNVIKKYYSDEDYKPEGTNKLHLSRGI